MVKFVGQNVKLSLKVVDHFYASYQILIVDIDFLFTFEVDPENIVRCCNGYSLLVFTENKELWLTIQIVQEIKICLSLLSNIIESPNLVPICKE
jgi:hypothetical protein